MFHFYFKPMRTFLRSFYEKAWLSRSGPPLLLTAFVLLVTMFGVNAQTTLVQIGAGATGSGGFENAAPTGVPATDIPANNWLLAQSAAGNNRWHVGTAGTQAAGAYHAFIGPDGSTWSASNTPAVWQHIYRDVVIPPGESILSVNYRFKMSALDATFDFLQVRITDMTLNPSTPTAGSEWINLGVVLLQQNDGTLTYDNYSTATGVTPGNTVRVCISYRNDGFNPACAAAVDDIQVVTSLPVTFTATAAGGLWNSPATWAGGVVPTPGNDVVIPNGSEVVSNQIVSVRDLTVNGRLKWSGTFATTVTRNMVVGATGQVFMLSTTGTGQNIRVNGDLTNNGFIDSYFGTLAFYGTGNSQLAGTGTFRTIGGRGLIRTLDVENNGTFTLNQSQNITVGANLINTSNNFVTNGRLRVDNAVEYYPTSLLVGAVTNMGTGYASAPALAGNGAVAWAAGATAVGTLRVNGGQQYVSLDAVASSIAPTHTTFDVQDPGDGKSWLHVGPVGVVGTAFGFGATATAGAQYFWNGALYTCITGGATSIANINAALPFGTTVGSLVTVGTATFRCVGTPVTGTLNYDGVTQTVRSLNYSSLGAGITAIPAAAIVGGGGTGAVVTNIYSTATAGAANATGIKATASTFTGAVGTQHSSAPVGAAGNGVYSATGGASQRGWYNTVPAVGFSAPLLANLATAQGSGYGTTAPTVSVVGGTLISGAAMVAGDFQINVANGRVISVYCTSATSKIYSVPPTISLTGGSGAGATIDWGTSWPTATVTLSNGTDGQIESIAITNNGYGYVTAPTMAFRAAVAGEFAATAPTCRLQQLNLQWGFFTPQTSNPNNNSVMALVPANGRVNALTTSSAQTFTSNLEATALAPWNTNGNIDMSNNTIRFSHPDYTGSTGAVGVAISNATIELSLRGGAATATRTFPLAGGIGATARFVHTTGVGTISTGYTYTGIRATRTGAPSGTVNSGGSTTGIRTVRIDLQGSGVLTNLNATRTMTLFYNGLDGIVSNNPSLFLGQASVVTGPWEARSVTTGVGGLTATGNRVTAAAAPGPYFVNATTFFGWINNGFVAPPALAYNVVRAPGNITYNSIAPTALGGDNSGLSLGVWTDGDDAISPVISLVDALNNFSYQGETVTGFRVSTNGNIQLQTAGGATANTTFANSWSDATTLNVIAPFWEDLVANPTTAVGANNSIRYLITGTAPNRTVTIEWANMSVFGALGAASLAFQVRLVESNNSIIIEYGDNQMFNGTVERRYSYSMGLKGRYTTAYPTAGQVFAQRFENYNLFGHIGTQFLNLGANGLAVSPEPRTRYTFTPGAYVAPAAPTPTAPSNDSPGGAEAITSLSVFPSNIAWNQPDAKPRVYTTRFATAGGPAACGGPANARDVWFRFEANETDVTVRIYPSAGYIPRISVYTDDLSANLACVVGDQGLQTDAVLTGLTVNDFYLVRVSHDRIGTAAAFTPSAIANGSLSGLSITNGGSNYTVATPTFGGQGGTRLTATGGGGTSFVGSVSAVIGGLVTGGGFDGGNDYVTLPSITVEEPNWGITGDFAIVVYAPPVNDNCSGAIALTGVGGTTCNTGTNQLLGITTNSATPSPETIGACGTTPDDDLWYKFVATGNRARVQVQGNGLFDPALQLWAQAAGNCVGKTTLGAPAAGCVNSTGAGALEDQEFNTTPGTTYFIRVFHAAVGFGGGSFDICVTTIPDVDILPVALINPASAGGCGDPAQAVTVRIRNNGATTRLAGETVQYTVNVTGTVVANLNETIALATDLLVGEERNVTLAGTFNMNANGNYNFAVTATAASPADQVTANDVLTPAQTRTISKFAVPPAYVDGLNTQGPWVISQVAGTGNWVFSNTPELNGAAPTVPSFEGSGYLFFESFDFFSATSRAASPCFELPAGCSRMTFRMKRDNGLMTALDQVDVLVSTDGGATWSAPLTLRNLTLDRDEQAIRPYNESGPAIQWHQFSAPLSAYAGQTIRIALDAFSDFGNNIMVDDFRVEESVNDDVQPVSVVSPVPFFSCGNTTANVTVRVRNNSCATATNVPFTVAVGGSGSPAILNGTVPSIPANGEVNVSAGVVTITGNTPLTFTVTTTLPGDQVPANNNLGPIAIPLRPAPSVTTTLTDENLVLGFSTTINSVGSINTAFANVVNTSSFIIPAAGASSQDQIINVSGMGTLAANQITRFTVNILHSFVSDLRLTLIDPLGTPVVLFDQRGGGGDNLQGTVFQTGGAALTSGSAPFTGTFAPEQAFAGFSATSGSANGAWTLRVEDLFNLDGGSYQNSTITFPNALSQSDYTCPTCPVGFPASSTLPATAYPNNPLGATYPVGVYPITHTVNDRQGCSVVTDFTLNVFTTNRWLGINPGADNWNDAANWQSSPAPPTNLVAVTIPPVGGTVVHAPNINTTGTSGSMILQGGSVVNIGSGGFLNVFANWSGGANTQALGAGNVRFNGTATQVINGNTLFNNIRFDKPSGNVNIAGTAAVSGTLTIGNATSPITVLPGGKLNLRSTPTGTGRIASIPSGASIVGNVTMERYITPNGSGDWYLLATPVGGNNFSDWGSDFRVAGPSTSATGSHYGVQSSVLNVGDPDRATIFVYDETTHHTRFDTAQKKGWKIAPNTNILPGTGYRVYVDNYTLGAKQKFNNIGTVVIGPVNMPLTRSTFAACVPATFPCLNSVNQFYTGWNLVGNPLASAIDWDASGIGTWTKPVGLQDAYWRWHANANGYGVYVGGSGVWAGVGINPTPSPAPSSPNIIPSSQGFFVRMNTGTGGTLTVGENAKVATAGTHLRSATEVTNRLKLELFRDGDDKNYTGFVAFDPSASDGADDKDFANMAGNTFDFAFEVGGGAYVFTTLGALDGTKTVPVRVSFGGRTGNFKFKMSDLGTFDAGTEVYLRDLYNNTLYSADMGEFYEFQVNAGNASVRNRFELIFNGQALGVRNNLLSKGLSVYPNPTDLDGSTSVVFNGVSTQGSAVVTLTDLVGKVVYEQVVSTKGSGATEHIINNSLPAGTYTVKVSGNSKTLTTKLIIK